MLQLPRTSIHPIFSKYEKSWSFSTHFKCLKRFEDFRKSSSPFHDLLKIYLREMQFRKHWHPVVLFLSCYEPVHVPTTNPFPSKGIGLATFCAYLPGNMGIPKRLMRGELFWGCLAGMAGWLARCWFMNTWWPDIKVKLFSKPLLVQEHWLNLTGTLGRYPTWLYEINLWSL